MKAKITARKYNGDDAYSWAVFIGDRLYVAGLHRSEVKHYKTQAAKKES